MTDKQILKQMVSEMPYELPARLIPYIAEALQIARTEGIREGFEAARSLEPPTDVKNTERGVEVFEPFKYPTADDYLNRKK